MKKIILIILIISLGYNDEYYYSDDKKIHLKEIKLNISRHHKDTHSEKVNIKYYTTKDGAILGVNNDILVKCKKNTNCKQELLKYDFEKIEEISKNYYLLHLEDNTNIFALSREIYEESYIELSHPDFAMDYSTY